MTAPFDGVSSGCKSISSLHQRVGPERATGMQFLGAVEITRTLLQTSNAGATRHTRKCEPFLAEIQRTSTKAGTKGGQALKVLGTVLSPKMTYSDPDTFDFSPPSGSVSEHGNSYKQATFLLNLQTLCLECHKQKTRAS